MLIPDEKYFEHPIVNPRYLKKNYPEFYEYLLSHYTQAKSIAEALYMWRHEMKDRPVCEVCGNPVAFYGINKGFAGYCSYKCANKQSVNKSKLTKKEKYGDPNYNNREKASQTCLEVYGVDNPSKSLTVTNRIRCTNLKRYGYEYTTQVPSIIEKKNNTFKINHPGYNSPLQLKQTKENRDAHRKESAMLKHSDIIDVDVENKLYICSCPHERCNKCVEKIYKIKPSAYFDRKRDGTERCTNILPFDNDHNAGTSLEIFVRNILDEYNIEYDSNRRDILESKKELDIYIPSFNIAIECNGIYWHSTKYTSYHLEKWKECKNLGIQLITVWEDWIRNKPEIIKSIILSKFGIYRERIGARKCIIKEISSKICNEFLLHNHIQGPTKANVHLGMYYDNSLISVMTFGKKRSGMGNKIKKEGEYELSRFCSLLNTQVIGGAEKMLDYFISHFQPSKIYSFSSNDISNGNLYKKLGFKETRINSSYWYIDGRTFKRYHRSSFTKSDIVRMGWKSNKTGWVESEVMIEYGYFQIYDSGQVKWELII